MQVFSPLVTGLQDCYFLFKLYICYEAYTHVYLAYLFELNCYLFVFSIKLREHILESVRLS